MITDEKEMSMHKTVILLSALTLAISGLAHGQSFKVRTVSENAEEAVLYDFRTGEDLSVSVGHETEGWVITEITPDHVTIMRPGEEGCPALKTELPARSRIAPEVPGTPYLTQSFFPNCPV